MTFRPPIPLSTKQAVWNRSGCRCEDCGVQGVPLEFHHVRYTTWDREPYKPERYEREVFGEELPEDLAYLCRSCHHARHVDIVGNFHVDPQDRDAENDYIEHMWFSDD